MIFVAHFSSFKFANIWSNLIQGLPDDWYWNSANDLMSEGFLQQRYLPHNLFYQEFGDNMMKNSSLGLRGGLTINHMGALVGTVEL